MSFNPTKQKNKNFNISAGFSDGFSSPQVGPVRHMTEVTGEVDVDLADSPAEKPTGYFPWNPGCLIGILISWFMT